MQHMSEEVDVVIVGAGLAGLNAAITVQRAGRSLLVLEAADAVGGRMRTDEVDGLQLDRGFQILNPAYPELVDLGLLEELDLRPFDAGIMVALEQGIARLGDPRRRPQWLLSSVLSGVGDVSEKAKLMAAIARIWMRSSLANPMERAGSVEQSLQVDGVGARIYERVLRPFLSGVFLDDPEQVAAGHGDFVVRSFLDGRPSLPARGMGALPKAMALRLPREALRLNTAVHEVAPGRVRVDGGEITARQVIVAVDPRTAGSWFPKLGVPDTRACTSWYHVTRQAPAEERAILVDGLRRGPVMNSVALSKVAPGYASGGRTLMSSTALGRLPSAADEQAARAHLASMWGTSTADWELVRTDVIEAALPSLAPGQPMARTVEVEPGLLLAGDHRNTPSQQGALLSGRRAARVALRALQ